MKTDLLVVGGGIAGITAAVEAAEVGKDVILIEREHYLGGRVVQLHRYFPKICPPGCGLEINFRRIRQNPKITVLTGAVATKIDGKSGAYTAEVNVEPRYVTEACTNCGDCVEPCDVEVDDQFNFGLTKSKAIRLANDNPYPNRYFIDSTAVNDPNMKKLVDICPAKAIDLDMKAETVTIEAKSVIYSTGWEPYDASKLEGLNFDVLPNVVTNMMFERMTSVAVNNEAKVVRPSDGSAVNSIAFVQCAGSRDRNHLPYCSAICCMASLKQTRYVRDQYQDAEIHVFFIDARTPGRWEDFYQNVQDDTKTIMHRGKVGKIEDAGNGNVTVIAENTLTGKLEKITVEMAVLATGMVPNAKSTKPVIQSRQDEFGFIWPGGVIAAGVATGPKDVAGSNQDATAAVARAMQDMVEV